MSDNAFIGRAEPPTEADLGAALGAAKPVWDRLLAELARENGADIHEWKCYSPKAGWSLRVKRKARTVVWLGPRQGSFIAAFILGEKALQTARAAKLPARILKAIEEAPKYPEGTGVRIPMKTPKDIAVAGSLAAIKIAN
jgi:hypothetical protein